MIAMLMRAIPFSIIRQREFLSATTHIPILLLSSFKNCSMVCNCPARRGSLQHTTFPIFLSRWEGSVCRAEPTERCGRGVTSPHGYKPGASPPHDGAFLLRWRSAFHGTIRVWSYVRLHRH